MLPLLIFASVYASKPAKSQTATKSVTASNSTTASETKQDNKYYLPIAYGNASPVPVSL